MKKFVRAAFALLAITSSFTGWAQNPFEYGLHFSPEEIAAWRQRATAGPYRVVGDDGANTPNDYQRILQYANEFRSLPNEAGNTNTPDLDLWTGYPVGETPGNSSRYPIWQGIKMSCAGLVYLINGDTTYGQQVRKTLLAQIAIPGTNVGLWPATTNYEAGSKEAIWLLRLLYSYDYTKALYTPEERDLIFTWFKGAATYFVSRVNSGPITQCFPNRLLNNYSVLGRDAAPGGIPSYPSPIYAQANNLRNQWVGGDGYIYTHRKADGTLGNRVARVAMHFNNRMSERVSFAGQCGILTGDTMLAWNAKQYCREWLKYSVYPDGTMGEFERNGDYNNPSQGFFYGAMNMTCYTLIADALARKGDLSLYTYTTSEGVHGTQGGPKSYYTVIDRYARLMAGQDPIYWNQIASNNRIDEFNNNGPTTAIWDIMFSISNKYYQSDYIKNVYRRRAPGILPTPFNGYATAGGVWLPWGGTGAEMPGILFMAGQLESLNTYGQLPCTTPQALAVNLITHVGAEVKWQRVTRAQSYNVRYRLQGDTNWTVVSNSDMDLNLTGLTPTTPYETQVQTLCPGSGESAWSNLVRFATVVTPCPSPTSASASGITQTQVQINATSAAPTHRLEFRVVGAATWQAIANTTLPITIATLVAGTTYEYHVRSECGNANNSEWTPIQLFTTLPVPCLLPTGIVANTVTQTSANIVATTATAVRVEYRSQGSATWLVSSDASLPVALTGLTAYTVYEYRLRAECGNGNNSTFSTIETLTTLPVPCITPTAIAASGITASSASITASGVIAGQTIRIEYRIAGASTWLSTTNTVLPIDLVGLTSQTSYEYRMRMECGGGNNSAYSAIGTFVTLVPTCPVPANLTATPNSTDSSTMRWAAVSGVQTFQIRLKPVTGTNWKYVVITNSLWHKEGSMLAGTQYEVQVKSQCTSTNQSGYSVQVLVTMPVPPCPVLTSAQASGIMHNAATLTWTSPGTLAQRYEIKYKPTAASVFISDTVTTLSAALTGLNPSTSYQAQVRSLCNGNSATTAANVTFTTTAAPICAVATGLAASGATPTRIILGWAAQSGTSYKVRFKPRTGTLWTVVDATTSPLEQGGLTAATAYEAQIQAICSSTMQSAWSVSVLFSTTSLPCLAPTGLVITNQSRHDWVRVSWNAVALSVGYKVRYRQGSTAIYTYVTVTGATNTTIRNLVSSTTYEVAVANLCSGGGESTYTSNQTFVTQAMPSVCQNEGTIRQEIWSGVTQWSVLSGAPARAPNRIVVRAMMEDTMRTTATISRIRGFMCIAEAGDYQFAIAAGKEGRIYLSPTADSSNAPSIGSSFGDYGPRAIVDAGQRSAILTFTAGQRIYLSALWGGVTKHYGTVLWRTPGSTTFVPIPASAFTSNAPIPSLQPTAVEQEATTAITLYPNPSKRQGEVYLEGMTGRGHMEVLSSTGGLVIRAELPAQTGRRNLSQLSGLNSGVYVVHLKTSNSRPMRQRLVVE